MRVQSTVGVLATGPYPQECAHVLFEARVAEAPTSSAILYEDQSVSYSQLNTRANCLAHYLQRQGVGPEVPVGVYVTNSVEAIVAVLGILKAGGVFVPLERTYPRERLEYLIKDAELKIVLTNHRNETPLSGLSKVVSIADTFGSRSQDDLENPPVRVTLDNAACVLYTSGSTGEPKGVVRPHRAIVHRLAWVPFHHNEVFCHNMSLSFGMSQERMFLPLMFGHQLVVLPDDVGKNAQLLVSAIASSGITNITLTPPILRQLLSLDRRLVGGLNRLRSVAIGGGQMTPDLLRMLKEILPHIEIVNAYGSTEAGSVIRSDLQQSSTESIPLGEAVAGAQAHILDDDMMRVPHGVVGELFVGGPSLARTYLKNPKLTAERFVPNPFAEVKGDRLYRTGDLAKYLPNGEIQFVGRTDRQVKIRGYRVELGEIEQTLQRHPSIQDIAVVSQEQRGNSQIVAYVVSTIQNPTTTGLREYALSCLPEYMVPATFVFLDKLPRTGNEKVDVKNLPAPPATRPNLATPYEAPRDEVEIQLAEIWTNLLQLETVGINDNLFELGGDSLLLTQLLLRIEEMFKVELPLGQLMDRPTISNFSGLIQRTLGSHDHAISEPIPSLPRDRSISLTLNHQMSLSGQFHALVQGNSDWQPLTTFGFSLRGELNLAALEFAINEIIRRHDILRVGFSPTTSVGVLSASGWQEVAALCRQSSLKPGVRFEMRLHSDVRIDLSVTDLEHFSPEDQQREIEKAVDKLTHTPIDYAKPPLIRAGLLKLADQYFSLLLCVSHLVFDGWSRSIFQRELIAFYDAYLTGRPDSLPKISVQYSDYTEWQRNRLRGGLAAKLANYWGERYRELSPFGVDDLPFNARRVPASRVAAQYEFVDLEDPGRSELRQFILQRKTTSHVVFLSATAILFHILSKRSRITLVSYFANRTHPETRNLIGDFATSHFLGLDFSKNPLVDEMIEQSRDVVLHATDHQDLSLSALNSLIPAMTGCREFAWDPTVRPITCESMSEEDITSNNGLTVERLGIPSKRSNAPLRILWFESRKRKLSLGVGYQVDVLEREAAEKLLVNLREVLYQMVANPTAKVSSIASVIA